ncbi:FAD-binding oxidoreductase, partial [Agromyces soli]
ESALARRGLPGCAVVAVRLVTADRRAAPDLVEVVAEEFERLTATATIDVVVGELPEPGMLVALHAEVAISNLDPSTPSIEGTAMHSISGASGAATVTDLGALRALSSVLLPGDPGYIEACRAWNLAVRQLPAAVAVPGSIEEVRRIVRTATGLGLRIAPQSTGHAASALEDVAFDDVVLLRMHRLTGVVIDPVARVAIVQGGTLWRDVIAAAAPHGLTALHGSAGDVAVAGYVLGGGVSFYGRRHGLASGSVRALEVVTESGELVRATADEHAALFWALRGGGGNFGVVVSIELELLPIADVVAGMLSWDLARAPEVVRAWAHWTETVPESVTTSLRLMRFPPIPELPPFLSGRQLVVIDGALEEDDDRAAELLAPLRALSPELDTFARIPAAGLLEVHMDPPGPTPGVSAHGMLDALPEAAVEAFLAAAGPGVETPIMVAELRHLGGALARPIDAALSHLEGEFALFAVAVAPTPELLRLGDRATASLVEAMRPWSNASAYLNFADRPGDASVAFGEGEVHRLVRVRDVYDPRRVWVASHPVGGR